MLPKYYRLCYVWVKVSIESGFDGGGFTFQLLALMVQISAVVPLNSHAQKFKSPHL